MRLGGVCCGGWCCGVVCVCCCVFVDFGISCVYGWVSFGVSRFLFFCVCLLSRCCLGLGAVCLLWFWCVRGGLGRLVAWWVALVGRGAVCYVSGVANLKVLAAFRNWEGF